MALPMAPPMMRPMQMAVSLEFMRASHTARAIAAAKANRIRSEAAELGPLLEHPVAHALVPDENEIEKRGDAHGPLGADVIDVEHPGLVGLVQDQRDRGNPKPERR